MAFETAAGVDVSVEEMRQIETKAKIKEIEKSLTELGLPSVILIAHGENITVGSNGGSAFVFGLLECARIRFEKEFAARV